MKTFKIIVYSALLIFHITAIVIISVGRDDLNFLLNLFKNMDLMMYFAYLGLLLFIAILFFEWRNQQNLENEHEAHSKDVNQLKAKLYDQKESESTTIAPKTNPAAENLPSSEKSKGGYNKEDDKS